MTMDNRTRIADHAARRQLPTVSWQREYAEAGGLMAYGPSIADSFRRAATYVDKILKGAKPVASALGGPASENGRLCHGDGATKGGDRCRRGLKLAILSPLCSASVVIPSPPASSRTSGNPEGNSRTPTTRLQISWRRGCRVQFVSPDGSSNISCAARAFGWRVGDRRISGHHLARTWFAPARGPRV
jgi:hypothetical protein